MHVFFLSNGAPGPRLGGGPRRTHQLWHELRHYFGATNVTLISVEEMFPLARSRRNLLNRVMGRWKDATANPFQLVSSDRYGLRRFCPASLRRYRSVLQGHRGQGLCVMENSRLAPLTKVNSEMGIRTVLAPWSFDSLTHNLVNLVSAYQRLSACVATRRDRMQVRAAFTSFANDTIFSASITHTWLLSRLEAGFLNAAGIASGYLPYYPVGEAEECLRAVRSKRRPEAGLFVTCGGANDQNGLALKAFLHELRKADVPPGARIAIVGVREIPEHWIAHLGERIEFLGRLPEDEFDALLTRAHAVIIPQTCGFGCITRVPDMLCAGIPILANAIVANPTGEVPGVCYVANTPRPWATALHESMANVPKALSGTDFNIWHEAQRSAVRRAFASVEVP